MRWRRQDICMGGGGMCVRERESTAVVLAVRMPLEVCPGTRKTEHGRRTRMPKHIETTMQNTRQTRLFWPPTHTYYTLTHIAERKQGPARFGGECQGILG